MRHDESYNEKRIRMLENCYDCLCAHGLENTTTRMLCDACGVSIGTLFGYYFTGKDEAVVDSTAYCMARVGEAFMASAPHSMDEMEAFVREMPYTMCEKWGAKIRFGYQVYLSPKFREHGKIFMNSMVDRYTEYAQELALSLDMPTDVILPLIFWLVRMCVHYALFENEAYLTPQIDFMLLMIKELNAKYPVQEK